MKKAGTIRFAVSWLPSVEIENAAIAAGCPKDGSWGDYIEIYNHENTEFFADFKKAVRFAKEVCKHDMFYRADIDKQVCIQDRDDIGSWFTWQDECSWTVEKGEREKLIENEPHELTSAA